MWGSKLALIVAVCAPALQAQEREAPPTPAAPKGFTLPSMHEITLTNGMKITFVPYGTLPLATVSLDLRTGAIDEAPDQVWLSKLMADYLQQGTTTRSAARLADAVAGMGGDLRVNAAVDDLSLTGTVLGDSSAAFIRLIAQVARHPSFPDSELPRLIGDRQRQLAIARTNPQQIAGERYAALLYPDHPYGRLFPTSQSLGAYTTAQVRDFYTHNVGAARAHLYVIGHFDGAVVERAARAAFADWAAGQQATVNVPTPHAGRQLVLIDRPNAVQSTLDLGVPVADATSPDWIPMQVTDALLGGSFNSRITSNIREQKGYTYSPFSTVLAHHGTATWTESADVTTNVTGASLKEIFGEIDRLRATPPGADELTGIQHYLAGVFVLRASNQQGLLGQLQFVEIQGLGDDYLANYVKHVYAVTPADVQGMAEKYLDPAKMAIVVAGDKKTVADQLTPYGTPVQ
jgi:zinc protease